MGTGLSFFIISEFCSHKHKLCHNQVLVMDVLSLLFLSPYFFLIESLTA